MALKIQKGDLRFIALGAISSALGAALVGALLVLWRLVVGLEYADVKETARWLATVAGFVVFVIGMSAGKWRSFGGDDPVRRALVTLGFALGAIVVSLVILAF